MNNIIKEKSKVIINYGVISNRALLILAVLLPFGVSLFSLDVSPGILPSLFQLVFTESIIILLVILKFLRLSYLKSKVVCKNEDDEGEIRKCISELDRYRAIVTSNLDRHIKVRKKHNVDRYLQSIDELREYYSSLV